MNNFRITKLAEKEQPFLMQDDTKHVKIHSEPRLELEFNACLDARPEAGTCLPDGLLRDGVPRHADGGLEVIDIPMRRSI